MEIVGFFAGALTLFTYVPQSIKTIRTRKTRDFSLATLIMLCLSAILWVAFGLYKDLPEVWVTNSVVAVLVLSILSIKASATAKEKNT